MNLDVGKNKIIERKVAGYVMAGGASRRFGTDKALVEFDGKSLLSRICGFVQTVTGSVCVIAPRGRYSDVDVSVVEDRWPDEGPLGGIITALKATEESGSGLERNLIVSCDMPFLTREWLAYLCERAQACDGDVIVPRSAHGLEPLCACWRTSAAAPLQAAFNEGVRKVADAMQHLHTEVLDEKHWKRFDSAGQLFWNMNTPQDYEVALRAWERGKGERDVDHESAGRGGGKFRQLL
jgi:molybdopterin-guanine dinucleotide biosynthesis protein A